MATIVITGAAGFIGSHTADLLLQQGHRVVGVDDFRTGREANLADAMRQQAFVLERFDVAAPGGLIDCAVRHRADAIIHLAALVSVPESIAHPALNFRQNVEATYRVIEAASACQRDRAASPGPIRVVFASSAAVYGNTPDLPLTEASTTRPISPYGGAKLASEALLFGHAAASGFTVRAQRYFNVFGPRQDPKSPYSGVISIFGDKLKAGAAPTMFGDGEQTRDFIYVGDVARANALAATAPGIGSGVANICTGKATSLNVLFAALRQHFPTAPACTYAAPRAGDIRHSLGCPDRAKAELGFEASVSLEDGLKALVGSMAKG
jgi:UDP-glucose 4-epimerase